MLIAAGILLTIASAITLLVTQLVIDAHAVGGADAMGLIVVIAVLMAQWLTIVAAALFAARRGVLQWIHPSRVVQGVAASLWLVMLGVVSASTVVMAYGPDSEVMVPWAFGLAVVVPAALIAGIVSALFLASTTARALPWRAVALVITAGAAVGALQMFRLEARAESDTRAALDRAEQEGAQFNAARRTAFEALAPTAPLHDWLPWLQLSDDTGQRAITAVRARPTLEQDVAAMLRSDEAPEALRFMWLWMPDARSGLAAPARDAIATLPEWAEHLLSMPVSPSGSDDAAMVPSLRPADLSDLAQAAIVIADTYKDSGLDFESAVAAFSRTLDRHALPEERLGEDRTYQPRAFLNTWVKNRAATRSGRE